MTWLEYSLIGFLILIAIWIGRDLRRLPRVDRHATRWAIKRQQLNPNFLRRVK